MSERDDPATRIAEATGVQPQQVGDVVRLALQELHRLTIVDEKGPTAAVMEACFSFGGEAAFHLIGLFASEHAYHGRNDDADMWSEVAMRFIPSAYAEGCARIAPWFGERTPKRVLLDADLREAQKGESKVEEDYDPRAERYAKLHKEFLERHNPSVLSQQSDPDSYLSSAGSLAAESFHDQMRRFQNSPAVQKLPHLERVRALQNHQQAVEEQIMHDHILQPVPE